MVHIMLIYFTVCKKQEYPQNTASFLTNGFTDILRGWWANSLLEENRNEILNAVKKENNQQREDVVYTQVLAIIDHFSEK